MKCLIIGIFLHISGFILSQDINDPKTFSLEVSGSHNIKILNVKNDSVYLFATKTITEPRVILCNLNTGKKLAEIKLTDEYLGVTESTKGFKQYFFLNENSKISVFILSRNDHEFKIQKKIIQNDLTLLSLPSVYKLSLEDKKEISFSVVKKNDFYVFTLIDRNYSGWQRAQVTTFAEVITLDKNLKEIERTSFTDPNKSRKTIRIPDEYDSYGIMPQMNLGSYNTILGEKVIFNTDKKGKIQKFQSKELTNFDLFMPTIDSAGSTYGYCIKYAENKKRLFAIELVKFKLNFGSGKFEVLSSTPLQRTIEEKNMIFLNTQSLIKGDRFKLFVYEAILSGGGALYWVTRKGSYYELKNDTIVSRSFLPLCMDATNPLMNYSGINMIQGLHKNCLFFNDLEDNLSYNGNPEFEDVSCLYFEKRDSKIVGYAASGSGQLHKNYLLDNSSESCLMYPMGIWADKDGNTYIPYDRKVHGKTFIVKIPVENITSEE